MGGAFNQIIYAQDPKQSSLEVIRNYENAFKAAGWSTIHLSGAGDERQITMTKDEQVKKVWAGVGTNRTNDRIWATQTVVHEAPLPKRLQPPNAGPPPGEQDNASCPSPISIQRMAGAIVYECEHRDYDELEVITGQEGGSPKRELVEGRTWKLVFENDCTTSPAEVLRTYQDALESAGFQVVYSRVEPVSTLYSTPAYELAAAIPGKANVELSFYDAGTSWQTRMSVVEAKDFEQKLQVNAAALLEELRKNGRVAVYGILFDTAKATIRPESEKVLAEVLKLLQDNPTLKLRVEGHTDNVGKAKDNLKLSKQRAASMVAWLTKKGIDKKRLVADGHGDSKPVADNADEAGRAKNRRVELVKL